MNIQQAITIVKKAFPNGIIHKKAEYGNLYLFMVFSPDDSEGSMDAIYSINKETGEFRDFPYMDENILRRLCDYFLNPRSWGHSE